MVKVAGCKSVWTCEIPDQTASILPWNCIKAIRLYFVIMVEMREL
jgi:hypothetical protein